MAKRKWTVRSGSVSRVVYASDQWEAYDSLRDLPATEFGMVVQAEPDESGDPFPVRTSLLMFRWGRKADAQRFIAWMVKEGYPDTTAEDALAGAGKG